MAATTADRKVALSSRGLVWLQGTCGFVSFAVLLEVLPRLGWVSPHYLPPCSAMISALVVEMGTAAFWVALGATMRAWALGFIISVTAGTLIGIVIGSSNLLRMLTRSTIEFLRPIPSVALIPLAVLLFGSQLGSTLILVVYASFWQVLIQVLYGVQDVDPVARETAHSYGLRHLAQIRYVTWPTTLPYLMTGVRLAATVSLILAVTSEVVIGSKGLGKEISDTQAGGAVAVMYAYVIVTGLIGVMINLIARALERRVLAWHPSMRLASMEAGR